MPLSDGHYTELACDHEELVQDYDALAERYQVYVDLLAMIWFELFPDIIPTGKVEDVEENILTELARLKEVEYRMTGLEK